MSKMLIFIGPLALVLAGVVLGSGIGWLLFKWESVLMRFLNRRHLRLCAARNAVWRGRYVRRARTGRVGLCTHVCCGQRMRDLLWPRWVAMVIFDWRLAAHRMNYSLAKESRDLDQVILLGMRTFSGGVQRIPLKELTTAPKCDVLEFHRRMKGKPL